MHKRIFITGIGTDVGKTLVSAIVTEALQADYWKPVQAGDAEGTDALLVRSLIGNPVSKIYPERYKLGTPASPHIAARKENVTIELKELLHAADEIAGRMSPGSSLVIEGAGGLLVPLSGELMVADLIRELDAKVILVSRNYLGSINHSLLTAAYCRNAGLNVAGWIFSDDYMQYEEEIVAWSGYPSIGSIPRLQKIDRDTVQQEANRIRLSLQERLTTTV